MSIYWIAMWSVRPEAIVENDTQAITAVLEHIKQDHPSVLSVRTWKVQWGTEPARPGRIFMEEYASLTAIDEADVHESSPACNKVWEHIYALAVPGTFRTAIWTDLQRELWNG